MLIHDNNDIRLMSASADTAPDSDDALDQLPLAQIKRDITEAINELVGRGSTATVETSTDQIVITIDLEESSFVDEEEAEDVANTAPSYEQWLRSNSDRLEDVDDVPAGATYGEWLEARGGK